MGTDFILYSSIYRDFNCNHANVFNLSGSHQIRIFGRMSLMGMKRISKVFALQTTQHTRGGAITALWKTLCKLYRPLPPPEMGVRLLFFGQAGHADPLDGWQCSS